MSAENQYAAARRAAERHDDFLDLINTNFHSCGFIYPNESIIETLTHHFADESPTRLYTPDSQGSWKLREAIAEFYNRASLSASPEQIVVTASASECYYHIFAALSSSGDTILLPRPGYPIFDEIARGSGLEVTFYDQVYDADWQINPDAVEAAVSPRSRFLVLISPNNPTGGVVNRDTVAQLLGVCERHNLTLIVDEVFSDYLYEGALVRPAAVAQEAGSPVAILTINGVSKLFASPDVKVSWVVATGPRQRAEQMVELLATQNDLFLSCSQPNQVLVTSMLRLYPTFTRRVSEEVGRRRRVLLEALRDAPDIAVVAPEGGIHLPLVIGRARVPEWMNDEMLAVSLLEEARVATHPGYLYGFDEGGVRDPVLVTSFLARPEVIRASVTRIDDYLDALAGK